MYLLADENIPLLSEFFAGFGELHTLAGRGMRAEDVALADVLLVRSVTKVSRDLVAGSQLRWVGTATIGRDHVDSAALAEKGIALVSAPGCNARAVGEYVATTLALLAKEQAWRPQDKTLGIVGLGNTGRAVAELAAVLGFRLIGCDPAVKLPGVSSVDFDVLLAEADILTFHVPLTHSGPHATRHLLDAAALAALPAGRILINCSRGAVVDNAALLMHLRRYPGRITVVLDVWEGEPCLDPALLQAVRLGSPHVAGYSQEGKWRGTAMLYEQFCRFMGVPAAIALEAVQPPELPRPLHVPAGLSVPEVLAGVMTQACPLLDDDAALRASMAANDRGAAFDALRKCYPPRREFTAQRVILPAVHPAWPILAGLGFRPA